MAIAVDATSNFGAGNTNANPMSWNHTCSGSQRVLVVFVFSRSTAFPTGVTYNGVSMTSAIQNSGAGGFACSIWTLVAPSTGTNQISVSWAAAPSAAYGGAISFTGADQSNPVDGTASTNFGNFTSVSLTTSFDNSFVVASDMANNGPTLTPNAGQTSIFNTVVTLDATYAAAYKQQVTAGTATIGWTGSANQQYTAIGVKQASAAPASKSLIVLQAVNRASIY